MRLEFLTDKRKTKYYSRLRNFKLVACFSVSVGIVDSLVSRAEAVAVRGTTLQMQGIMTFVPPKKNSI